MIRHSFLRNRTYLIMFRRRFYTCLVGFTHLIFFKVFCASSDFSLDGDYLLGGLFPVHEVEQSTFMFTPEAVECKRHVFSKSGYKMFQVMRFAIEEINNSTTLLPNVSLGYEIFDHCSDTKNFPSVFSLILQNKSIKPQEKLNKHQPKIIALTGPYGSTRTLTVAPLVTMDLIPWVNYGATSYALSDKLKYPSFIRAVPSNRDLIQMIIRIIQWFGWNWVAFLGSPDDYSEDGLRLFNSYIRNTGICLAYQEPLRQSSNYSLILEKLDKLNINVIVIFALPIYAENIVRSAIANNIRDKVWIASETWSMNRPLQREPGIGKIGTIIGITDKFLSLSGFNEFIYKTKLLNPYKNNNIEKIQTCNQNCDSCSFLSMEEIINEDPTLSFAIYTAIYSIAHALHEVLRCDMNECSKNTTVKPYTLLREIKKLDFLLSGRQVKYDVNGDPTISYGVMLWHTETNPPWIEMVGTYDTHPEITFTINNFLLPWHNNTSVPFSNCSVECKKGFSREHVGYHDCCFVCKKCPQNTYVNYSRSQESDLDCFTKLSSHCAVPGDPFTCFPCAESEWSDEGSTACKCRSVDYLQVTELGSIAVISSTACLITMLILMLVIFAYNYNTPVVRSAGGSMCFLMLACLIISCLGMFFFFEQPTTVSCHLRNFMYVFFYTVCLSCLTVRAFQIVCVFKMAAKFPNVHRLWVKYNGQWLFVALFSVFYFIVCVIWMTVLPTKPSRDFVTFKDQILLICERGHPVPLILVVLSSWILGFLCVYFSYMARDLPKSYNEAKSITFSIIFFIVIWLLYFTAYVFIKGKYILLLNALAQVLSVFGILLSYFIPKSYIMLFQPKKNTAAYFQTSIQNYTQTISRS